MGGKDRLEFGRGTMPRLNINPFQDPLECLGCGPQKKEGFNSRFGLVLGRAVVLRLLQTTVITPSKSSRSSVNLYPIVIHPIGDPVDFSSDMPQYAWVKHQGGHYLRSRTRVL